MIYGKSRLIALVTSVVICSGVCVHASDWKDVVISCDDMKYDIEFLHRTLLEVHPNIYAHVDEDVFQKKYRQTMDGLKNPLSTIDFLREVAKLLFIIKDSHTNCSLSLSDRYMQHLAELDANGIPVSELASTHWSPIVTIGISWRMLKDYNAVILRSDTFADPCISEEYEAVFREIRENNIANLIIDIRNNPGGGSGPAERLLEYITEKPFLMMAEGQVKISQQARDARPNQKIFFAGKIGSLIADTSEPIVPRQLENRFKGKVYVLIGRRTASAASNFAQVVKHYGLGTLIGEETSGTTTGPGEQIPVKLPRSGLVVGISTKFFKEPGGEPDGRGVQPDHVVTLAQSDIQRNGDPVLEYILKLFVSPGEKEWACIFNSRTIQRVN